MGTQAIQRTLLTRAGPGLTAALPPAGLPVPVAALLLTGGASRRMGRDKALMTVDGETLATRLAGLVGSVLSGPALEVGPGVSGLEAVREQPAGEGPLAAVAAGAHHLRSACEWSGPALVLACDLPLLGANALVALATWPAPGSVVPVWEGFPQPLCARWARADLDLAERLAARGERTVRTWVGEAGPTWLEPSQWPFAHELADADTPEQWRGLGLDS